MSGKARGPQTFYPSPKQARILATLMERPGQLVTHDEIYRAVWPACSDRKVMNRRLRSEIEKLRNRVDHGAIAMVWGLGYAWVGVP